MSLRKKIEEVRIAHEEEENKILREKIFQNEQREKEALLKEKLRIKLKSNAQSHFNNILMPIFQEISEIKHVSLKVHPQLHPIRNGFFVEGFDTGMIIGNLIWDTQRRGNTDSFTWRYLSIGVDGWGETFGRDVPRIKITNSKGKFKLEKWLANIIGRNNGMEGTFDPPPLGETPSPGV